MWSVWRIRRRRGVGERVGGDGRGGMGWGDLKKIYIRFV